MKQAGQIVLVPQLRFPEFQDAGEWEEKKLEDVCSFVNQKIPLEQISLSDYVTTENLLPNYSGVVTASKLPPLGNATRFSKNDILISNIRPYLKKVWLADKDGAASNDVIVVRSKMIVSYQFLGFLLRNDQFIDYVMKGAKGVKMPRGDISLIKNYPLALPTLPEQQKIAECLASIDDRVTLETQKLDTLKLHKKGLMQKLFPAEGETLPQLRFPEFQDAGEWEVKKLDQIADPVSEKANNNDIANYLTLSAEHGIVAQGDYFGKKIAGENTDRYIKITVNDFVYNDRTTKLFIYGTIKRLSHYQSGLVSPIYKCFRFKKGENPVFWEWYFESGSHVNQLQSLINEGARAGRFNISIQKFLSILVWSPKPLEQQKIAECLASLDELITLQAQTIHFLKLHKKGLMQQLFPSV